LKKSIESFFELLIPKPSTEPTGTSNGSFDGWIASQGLLGLPQVSLMLLKGVRIHQYIMMITTINLSRYGWKTRFIKSMKRVGAFVNPNGNTKNS
jgi:hypothetical protein